MTPFLRKSIMTKLKAYQTVVLRESIGRFQKGDKGAVVEIYTKPYEAYDVELVTDDGKTLGLLEAVRPEQIEPLPSPSFTSIRVDADGTCVAVRFSDGTEMTVQATDLYEHKR
jgi:hypothetical protein